MLSLDITDRNIRIIRGTETGGKIKIQSSTSIELSEGLIVNGYVRDIAQMATIVNGALKEKKMSDKEAVVSLSSNLVVFKELHIPKAKPVQFKTMIHNQMQQAINVSEEQAIAYTIAGDIEEDGKVVSKVLATACPKDVVECYRKIFSMLGIALKSLSVSCNCISRIVLADNKIIEKMPLLLVQIDPNFININLYENGQLSFARFASISPDDYDDKSDYVFQAVNENIYRMIQFHRSRSSQSIQNVAFYGDTSEFIRLTNALEQMDIKSQLLKIPSQLSGYENLEFAQYANAIGSMFKRQKDIESINLLEMDMGTTNQVEVSGKALGLQIGAVFLACGILVGGVFGVLSLSKASINKKIATIDSKITSPETIEKLAKIDAQNAVILKLTNYKDQISVATAGVQSQPIFISEVLKNIVGCSEGIASIKYSYSKGLITLECTTDSLTVPAAFTQKLIDLDYFDNIRYMGFSSEAATGTPAAGAVAVGPSGAQKFTLTLQMRGPVQVLQETMEKLQEEIRKLDPSAAVVPEETPAAPEETTEVTE